MRGLLEDLKHALRVYRRTPGASLMVVVVLAIGMAFVAAFLSLYSDLILRPEPGFERKGGRIVSVGSSDGRSAGGLPLELLERMAEEVSTLDALAGAMPQQFLLGPERESFRGELVTRRFFSGLRPEMALGRGFTEAEHESEAEPVVVISWRLWQEQFEGRADVIGETLEITSEASRAVMISVPAQPGSAAASPAAQEPAVTRFSIVGVMGRQFTGTLPAGEPAFEARFWMPVERGLSLSFPDSAGPLVATMTRSLVVRGIGRLNPDASIAAVANELSVRFADEQYLQQRAGMQYEVIDRIVQNIFTQRATQRQLQLFLGASMLLALVAAANVSLFLLARAPGRRRELGIRMSVGAPVRRLARQLASEAAVLVVAAAVLGIALSSWLAQFLRGLPFLRQAQWYDVTLLDWRVLGLVGVFLLALTLLVSLAPILGLRRLGIAASSRQVSARATVAQRIAGTAQIAVAGVLGGAALAFAWHLIALLVEYPGYRTDLVAVAYRVTLPSGPIMIGADGQIPGVVDATRRREAFAAIPGVTEVSLATSAPGMPGSSPQGMLPDPSNPATRVPFFTLTIDPAYVELLGLRMLPGGRDLRDSEPGSVLVNQTFARRFYGREDVVGELVPGAGMAGSRGQSSQIVGVLQDLSYSHPLADVNPSIFSLASSLNFGGIVLARSELPLEALRKPFEDVARSLDLSLNGAVTSLAEARSRMLAPDRARGLLTIGTAALVVLLAAFGFYGTQRYLVAAGRREYAIRASLGAGPRALGWLVFRRGLLLGLPGLLLGLPLAFVLVAWLRDDYVSRNVPPVLVTLLVALLLVLLLLAASLGPARLARRTQPAPLLRED